jgi:hypothetical protein
MKQFFRLNNRFSGLLGWILVFIAFSLQGFVDGEIHAQNVEKDSTAWVGEWRDTGNLQYAFNLKLKPMGDGRVAGMFEWKLIWTSLDEHKPKVGAVAKEHLVGRYDAHEKTFKLVGIKQEDPADIISMDTYVIHVSADDQRIEGINIKPENYHGSLFGVKLEPKPKAQPKTVTAKATPVKPLVNKPTVTTSPSTKPEPKPIPKPSTAVADPAKPVAKPAKSASNELNTREIVTKTESRGKEAQVQIGIFDESIVDGDVISISWNGEWVLRYYKVVKLPKELVLDLRQGENTLVMYAENLGRYPPNTAAISMRRGSKVEQVILNSDMGESEAIKFIKE